MEMRDVVFAVFQYDRVCPENSDRIYIAVFDTKTQAEEYCNLRDPYHNNSEGFGIQELPKNPQFVAGDVGELIQARLDYINTLIYNKLAASSHVEVLTEINRILKETQTLVEEFKQKPV
jgi:hypothetical protein